MPPPPNCLSGVPRPENAGSRTVSGAGRSLTTLPTPKLPNHRSAVIDGVTSTANTNAKISASDQVTRGRRGMTFASPARECANDDEDAGRSSRDSTWSHRDVELGAGSRSADARELHAAEDAVQAAVELSRLRAVDLHEPDA